MNFGEKLKKLRTEQNITQEELAAAIFVSRTLITKYETGAVLPSKENVEKIAIYFNKKFSDLIDQEQSAQLMLDYFKTSRNANKIASWIIISLSTVWSILIFLPIFSYERYVNPFPNTKVIEYSLMSNAFSKNNPMVLISLIVCIVNVILVLLSAFIAKRPKNQFVLRWIAYVFFIISLFIILFAFIVGISIGMA